MGFLSAFQKKPAGENQQSVEKLSALIASYVQRLETKGGTLHERSLTLIARSPSAPVTRALALQAAGLKREQVSASIIFARLAPFEKLAEFVSALELPGAGDGKPGCVRLIRTPALLNAHEQLVLGSSSCWTGDMLRRSEENRNGLDLWEDEASGSVKLAQFAFDAIWAIAKPVPARILSGGRQVATDRGAFVPAFAAAGLTSGPARRRSPGSSATRH